MTALDNIIASEQAKQQKTDAVLPQGGETKLDAIIRTQQNTQLTDNPLTVPARDDGTRLEPSGDSPVKEAAETEDRSLLNRSARSGARDILSTPGAIGGLASMARAGFDWTVGNVDEFGVGMMNAEGRELYNKMTDPNSTELDKQLAAKKFQELGNDVLRPGAKMFMEWYDWGGEVAGVQYAEDGSVPLDEELGGLALTTALTLPLLPARAVSVAAKAGQKVTQRALLKGVTARTLKAAEFLTPVTVVRQGASPAEIAATVGVNGALGLAMTEVSRALGDEETLVLGENSIYNRGGTTELDTKDLLGTGVAVAAVGGATALASMRGSGIRRGLDSIIKNVTGPEGVTLDQIPRGKVGDLKSTNVSELATDIVDHTLDDKGVIKRTLERTGVDEERVDNLVNLVKATTSQTSDIQFKRMYNQGILDPEGKVRTVPGRVLDQKYDAMDKGTRNLFTNAYSALDELWRRQNIPGYKPSFAEGMTDDFLKKQINAGRANKQVADLMRSYKRFHHDMSTARKNAGIIDEKQMLKEQGSNYMHNIEANVFDTATDRIRAKLFRGMGRRIGVPPSEKTAQAGGMIAKVPPMDALRAYTLQQAKNMGENRVRREVLYELAGKYQQRTSTMVVKKLHKGEKPSPNTNVITVRSNGKEIKYAVGDNRLYNALAFRPRMTLPPLNIMRRVFQKTTTGNLNPLFSFVSAIYDHGASLLGARVGRQVSGRLDQAIKRAMENAGFSDNVTNVLRTALSPFVRTAELPANFLEGTAQGIRSRYKELMVDRAIQHAHHMGLENVDTADMNKMIEEFLGSAYAIQARAGYSPGAFNSNLDAADDAVKMMKSRFQDHGLTRMYVGFLDSVRDSARMAAFARNIAETAHQNKRKIAAAKFDLELTEVRPEHLLRLTDDDLQQAMPSGKQLRSVSATVKDMGSDVTNQSGSQIVNAVLSAFPYGNVIMQSTAHLLHHALTNPAAWTTISAFAGMRMLTTETMSPEAREYYETQIPSYKRTDEFWFEWNPDNEPFDPDKHMRSFPITPELGFITQMTARIFTGAARAEGWLPSADEAGEIEGSMGFFQSLSDLVGFSTPPLINVVSNIAGLGDTNFGAAMQGRGMFRDPRRFAAQDDQRGYGLNGGMISDRIAGTLNAAFGTMGRVLSDTLEVMLDHPMGALSPEAWNDAMDVAVYQGFERQKVGQLLTNATIEQPRTTFISEKAYDIDRALEIGADLARTLDNSSDINNLYKGDMFAVFTERLENPVLAQQAHLLHRYFLSSYHQDDMDRISELKILQHKTRGNVDLPIEERNQRLNEVNQDIQSRFARVLRNYGDFEQKMRQRYDDPNWTLDGFIKKANKDVYD